jgi:hypothetical protein
MPIDDQGQGAISDDKSHLDTIAAAIAASDGTTAPEGSEIHDPAQQTSMSELLGQQTEVAEPQLELSEHAQNFLQHVPEEHRAIVSQYLQPWDAGAQRRFRQYQDELATYQSYGEPEILEKATFLYNELMADPARFRGILDQVVSEQQPQSVRQPPQQQPQFQQPQYTGAFDELDPDVVNPLQAVLSHWGSQFGQRFQTYDQKMAGIERLLNQINQRFTQEDSSAAQQREEARLQEELALLEKQYGQFDQSYVLSQIAAGVDPDEAVQNFQNLRNSIAESLGPRKQLPGPTLSGNGLPPAQPADFNTLSSKQVRELVAQALQQSQED